MNLIENEEHDMIEQILETLLKKWPIDDRPTPVWYQGGSLCLLEWGDSTRCPSVVIERCSGNAGFHCFAGSTGELDIEAGFRLTDPGAIDALVAFIKTAEEETK